MELFFLCTIIMAGISFLSIALSQPPVNYSIKMKGKSTTTTEQTEETTTVSFNQMSHLPEMAVFSVAV